MPKSKGIHVCIHERIPVSPEVEVNAPDMPRKREDFSTTHGLEVHPAGQCGPGQSPASN